MNAFSIVFTEWSYQYTVGFHSQLNLTLERLTHNGKQFYNQDSKHCTTIRSHRHISFNFKGVTLTLQVVHLSQVKVTKYFT